MRKVILIILITLAVPCQLRAYPDKDFSSSGQINDGDYWNNVNIHGDDTVVDMFGGWVLSVTTYDESTFNYRGGTLEGPLTCSDNSTVNIWEGGGSTVVEEDSVLNLIAGHGSDLSATGGLINLYAYDVIYDSSIGGCGGGIIEGKYYYDDSYFGYDLYPGTYSYINIVPEPVTISFLGLGWLFLRKRKQ